MWVRVPPEVLAARDNAGWRLRCQCGGMVDTPASKAGARLGVRVRVSRLVLGETKRFNTSARVRVLWPTLGRVALWLVPLRGVFSCGGWCAGSCCALRVLDGCFVSLFLDSNPARCRARLLIGSLTLCGWGSIPLLSAGVHAPVCWGFPAFALAGGAWASLFFLSGPCSRGCRAAWADAPSGGVRVSPVYLRSGRCRCCRVRVGNARSPVWGWCGFRAWRRWGVGDDGIPRDCTRCGCSCGVSLYSSARCCSLGLRVCLSVRAWLCEWRVVVCACCAICFWWGVLLRSSQCARLAVCLSAILGVLRMSIALGEEDAVG